MRQHQIREIHFLARGNYLRRWLPKGGAHFWSMRKYGVFHANANIFFVHKIIGVARGRIKRRTFDCPLSIVLNHMVCVRLHVIMVVGKFSSGGANWKENVFGVGMRVKSHHKIIVLNQPTHGLGFGF